MKIINLLINSLIVLLSLSECTYGTYRTTDDPFTPRPGEEDRFNKTLYDSPGFGRGNNSRSQPSDNVNTDSDRQRDRGRNVHLRWADEPENQLNQSLITSNTANQAGSYIEEESDDDSDLESEHGIFSICNRRIILMMTPLLIPFLIFSIYFIITTSMKNQGDSVNATVVPTLMSTTLSTLQLSSMALSQTGASAAVAALQGSKDSNATTQSSLEKSTSGIPNSTKIVTSTITPTQNTTGTKRRKRHSVSKKKLSHTKKNHNEKKKEIFKEYDVIDSLPKGVSIHKYSTTLNPSLIKNINLVENKKSSKTVGTIELEPSLEIPMSKLKVKTAPSYEKDFFVNTSSIKPSKVKLDKLN